MTAVADAHIEAQARLRAQAATMVSAAWTSLQAYDEAQVPLFTAAATATVIAAQRASVALTDAFIAKALGRRPLGIPAGPLIANLRGGTPPADVYRRPFVTTWTDLKAGRPWADAVAAGEARATSTAEMDVQLAMRQTLVEVGQRDQTILGYQRVPDADACAFCRLVAGMRYLKDQLLPVHNRCGCGVDVVTAENRHLFTGKPANDLAIVDDGTVAAAVREHGELGPVLVDASQRFTSEAEALAA